MPQPPSSANCGEGGAADSVARKGSSYFRFHPAVVYRGITRQDEALSPVPEALPDEIVRSGLDTRSQHVHQRIDLLESQNQRR